MRRMSTGARWTLGIALAFAALQIASSAFGPYGYFIDELYYAACAKRLAFGYVDHPPLSIAVLAAAKAIFGASATAIRLPSIAAVAATIYLAGALARRFGGGAFAQALAALAFATSPLALIVASFASMNAFELLFWALLAFAFVELVDRRDGRVWIAIGAIIGLGLENKHTMVLVAAALTAGVLLTPARAELGTRWPWIGLAVALSLILPNLLWQRAHGFPSLEFYRNAQALKNVETPPLAAFVNQVRFAGPGALVVWAAGAAWLLRADAAKPYRPLGWVFALLFALALFSGSSRPDRIAGVYPTVLAAGGVAIERLTAERRRVVRAIVVALPIAFGAVLAPLALPALSPATVAAYGAALGIVPRIERGKTSPLPQWLADRTGWPELAADVDAAVATLSPEERARAAIFAASYGPAGAVERFGTSGLPVIANHNSYWFWGPGERDVETVVALGGNDAFDELFEEHHLALVHHCPYCMSWRDGMRVVVYRHPRAPLASVWDRIKHFE
jgi:4-amino-4-deoxy-L-arabinose transferase-like glycosyltransferase